MVKDLALHHHMFTLLAMQGSVRIDSDSILKFPCVASGHDFHSILNSFVFTSSTLVHYEKNFNVTG